MVPPPAPDEAPPVEGEPLGAPTIRLDQFLKWKGLADSGGQAKIRIQAGEVRVDGEVETRRSRRLRSGARVTIDGVEHRVELEEG